MKTTLRTRLALALLFFFTISTSAQHEDKPRPEAWNKLVYGARFMDRILPAPIYKGLETDIWGADAVIPRDIHNGIEDPDWSYWRETRIGRGWEISFLWLPMAGKCR